MKSIYIYIYIYNNNNNNNNMIIHLGLSMSIGTIYFDSSFPDHFLFINEYFTIVIRV